MGQSASKGLSKVAEKAAKQAPSQLKRPPIPSRMSQTPEPSAENPASFLRGVGIGAQDIRDRGQEMYLKHAQQQRQQQHQREQKLQQQQSPATASNSTPATNTTTTPANTEMPADLLEFIQDAGPAKQTVDREFTTTRLLKKENSDELKKVESARTAKRERVRMPLMQGNDSFTTEKNTNFSVGPVGGMLPFSADEHDFGLSNLQLYDFLVQKDVVVDDFHKNVFSDGEEKGQPNSPSSSLTKAEKLKAENSKAKELALLSQTLDVLEVPTLRMNADGDILGLYTKDVPGPEMTSITTIPESKIIMVLKDLSINGNADQRANEKLGEHRQERKAI